VTLPSGWKRNDSPQASSGLRRSLGSTTRKVHDDSLFSNDLIAGLV